MKKNLIQSIISVGQYLAVAILHVSGVISYPWFLASSALFLGSTVYSINVTRKTYKKIKSKND